MILKFYSNFSKISTDAIVFHPNPFAKASNRKLLLLIVLRCKQLMSLDDAARKQQKKFNECVILKELKDNMQFQSVILSLFRFQRAFVT